MAEYNPNLDRIVAVVGGSGFLGRHVVRALARRGFRVRAGMRRPELAGHLQPMGSVGQILTVQTNVRSRESVERLVEGAHAVVNLVGILFESGRQSFDTVQAGGARAVAECARAAGAERLVHVSAIGADASSPSAYARSKAAGEAGVLASFPGASILRPSIVFGPEDQFFNRFAAMARLSPVLPVVGAETRFQPVFVGDVGSAVAAGVEGRTKAGAVYELGGPDVRTFRELMTLMLEVIDRRRAIVALPFAVASAQAGIMERLPGTPLLTRDQVELLRSDNVVSEEARRDARTFEGLGIAPQSLAVVLPTYLGRFRRFGQFSERKPMRSRDGGVAERD